MTTGDLDSASGETAQLAWRSALRDALRADAQAEPAAAGSGEQGVSLERIAAYLEGALTGTERAKIHAKMLSSPAFYHEVMALADYLEAIEGPGAEEQPDAPSQAIQPAQGNVIPFAFAARRAQGAAELRRRFEMPASAAAAGGMEGGLEFERELKDGGRVSGHKSPAGDALLIVCEFADKEAAPRKLFLKGANGETAETALPDAYSGGKILLIKKCDDGEDSRFIRLLRDPRTEGVFE